jgi:hypothetical protein
MTTGWRECFQRSRSAKRTEISIQFLCAQFLNSMWRSQSSTESALFRAKTPPVPFLNLGSRVELKQPILLI